MRHLHFRWHSAVRRPRPRSGAPRINRSGRELRSVSRQQGFGEICALRDAISLHRVSCGPDAGRHDDGEPFDAEGEDLLCLPSAGRLVATAYASGEGGLRRLP